MAKPQDQSRFSRRNFQVRPRMRVPEEMLDHTYRFYTVDAVRRHPEIDQENLYEKALQELVQDETADVLADLSTSIEALLSGGLKGKELETSRRILDRASRLDSSDDAYPSIAEFNRRYLNENGIIALLTLLIFDAADLDPVAIDTYRGGETLLAAYGPRKTQQHKRTGTALQAMLKQFPSVDESATREAADRYVEYRFLDGGSLPDYIIRTELAGDPRGNTYLRGWFKKFDQALGFPPPRRGRRPHDGRS